ncbi:MAG TPA: ATP-binding protein [Methanolinea sp.]|nr:ATP-binding protein [Methanolinea sp.]HQK55049.1 ATP-binding protein [Methanolinea sp.]
MKALHIFDGQDGAWNAALIATTAGALLLNLVGLFVGITIVVPHLLYIPVVIGAYRFPRQGVAISAGIGGGYLLLVMLISGTGSTLFIEALIRACVVVLIGWLIAVLSGRLREQEDLYRGLFDNSEAGSILVREMEGRWTVEEVNWNAARLLGREIASLRGAPLSTFLSEDVERALFRRLASEGRIYAEKAVMTTPDGSEHHILVSIAALPGNRAIITGVDITGMVNAEEALRTANEKLSLLSRISSDHLHRTVNEIIEAVDKASAKCQDTRTIGFLEKVRGMAWTLARQIFLTETYHDLGASPPEWIRVQEALRRADASAVEGKISVRFWAERLEVYADPLFCDVMSHLVENAIRHGATVRNIIVSYRETQGDLEIFVEDDGCGIPDEKKESIFEYDAGRHAGLGLFICRQILSVTGMSISEVGRPGKGARFSIRVPDGNWRIEGASEDAPPFPLTALDAYPRGKEAFARELLSAEFPVANELWVDYHQTKGDPATDRIFAAFAGGAAVSLARCRRHPDGLEVDAVFTPVAHRGHGYAHLTVGGLIEACGHEPLYMHSVLNLTGFYGRYGFVSIREDELPATIRERFAFAGGQLEGANVQPMKREPSD